MAEKKGKILLVEDDNILVEMYKMKLTEEGYEVFTSSNGVDALEIAKKESPEIILLDIILPGMDGFAILGSLKGEQKTKQIPVILLSNLGQDSDIEKGKKLGAQDYLVKANFTPTQVAEKIRVVLKK